MFSLIETFTLWRASLQLMKNKKYEVAYEFFILRIVYFIDLSLYLEFFDNKNLGMY